MAFQIVDSPAVRFERFVERIPESGCWLWMGSTFKWRGKVDYGCFSLNGKQIGAHRAALILRGVDVSGLHVCHHCDVPLCVNPAHLFVGSHTDNMRDMARKGRNRYVMPEHFRKLTSDQVIAIRATPGSLRAVGKLFGVHYETVRRIRNGTSWANS